MKKIIVLASCLVVTVLAVGCRPAPVFVLERVKGGAWVETLSRDTAMESLVWMVGQTLEARFHEGVKSGYAQGVKEGLARIDSPEISAFYAKAGEAAHFSGEPLIVLIRTWIESQAYGIPLDAEFAGSMLERAEASTKGEGAPRLIAEDRKWMEDALNESLGNGHETDISELASELSDSGNHLWVTRYVPAYEAGQNVKRGQGLAEVVALERLYRVVKTLYPRPQTNPLVKKGATSDGVLNFPDSVPPFEVFVSALKERGTGLSLANVFEGFVPVHPQFERLAMAYTQYQGYAAAGGWEKLKGKRELKKGKSGTQVLALRERLKAEGYDVESEAPQVFGGTLRAALKTYQLHHYLRVTGILEEKTRKSLNIPVESRLESIGTTLWKWRTSRIQDVNVDHVFVNISGFTGQLWRGGKREHEFKVAVGKRKKFRDDSRQWVYPNATPELHSEITHVVVNPKWNIPSKIFKEEILPKIEKDPLYAEEHHYVLTGEPGAYKSAYQSSGPWNALGKVKFVFSNSEAIFLHDTPGKRVFRRAQRAASHGCVRVEGALDLAQMILEPERRWKKKYREEEENSVEKWIGIKAALPVFLESYTVRVGDKGAVYFGSDLYKRDTQLREEYLGLRASHSEKAAHAPLPSSGD